MVPFLEHFISNPIPVISWKDARVCMQEEKNNNGKIQHGKIQQYPDCELIACYKVEHTLTLITILIWSRSGGDDLVPFAAKQFFGVNK
jgi:hypothetical protein